MSLLEISTKLQNCDLPDALIGYKRWQQLHFFLLDCTDFVEVNSHTPTFMQLQGRVILLDVFLKRSSFELVKKEAHRPSPFPSDVNMIFLETDIS